MDKSWSEINIMTQEEITFLLYKEGKSLSQISLIRRLPIEEIQKQIISQKRKFSEHKLTQYDNSMLIEYLSLGKEERLSYLLEITEKEKNSFEDLLEKALDSRDNIEDLMILIWTIGEGRFENLKDKLKYFSAHPHGNIRRMSFSAMGKFSSEEFLPYVIQGLKDKKPQVRQYAIKAFEKIGNYNHVDRLFDIIMDPEEKEYVKRAANSAIEIIQNKMESK
ncbi:23S rRNA maturation mini-RNase III [Acetoanaerobium pronyense]|uniref:23S rRNA maturation mini-RNase III n=1 Tax=Acetoanaerobium pronyense TaxID=1482736 RepID=A0ABS4KIK1_9FIRM|nr:HEAT repeat domain-containing protein [Acetoanaerobium pronyense]MBP2027612.1 23S rRNA maturation mini-RNase III [Acetoanaerobium pronyense]